jgi:L-aminopeptidase/D-esterase-like protein
MNVPSCLQVPLAVLLLLGQPATVAAQSPAPRSRAHELGIRFGGQPGPLNSLTDVPGVEVGHVTLSSGQGRRVTGKGPVRTGVTAVLPRGKGSLEPVFAATYALNGNGEMTGTHWLNESGLLHGPVMLTNTSSVGVVRDAVIAWALKRGKAWELGLPVVAETYDGMLNDVDGFHVKPEHAWRALDGARGGPVAEGSVGGGTGMICHGFKGGIGTASRKLSTQRGGYTVGVLVQCNYGQRRLLSVDGVPVGQEIQDLMPCHVGEQPPAHPMFQRVPACSRPAPAANPGFPEGAGSIIVVVATDAPVLPHQLERLAKRVPLGIGKMGGLGEDSSGDIFLAFSTQPASPPAEGTVAQVGMLGNDFITPLFEATVQATQEAILNAMLASETQTGADDVRVFALPHDRLVEAMKKYGRGPR